jgi:hypothetical protein
MQTQLKIASRSCVIHILSSVLFSQGTHHITPSKISKLKMFCKTAKGAPHINSAGEMSCYLKLK